LSNDRDVKPLADLSHGSVLRPQGVSGVSHRQYAAHYVQDGACRVKGASRRQLRIRSLRLCEDVALATQLLLRLQVRNPAGLAADSSHNEQCELPIPDTAVVLVQVAQRRQALGTEEIEPLNQGPQLQ